MTISFTIYSMGRGDNAKVNQTPPRRNPFKQTIADSQDLKGEGRAARLPHPEYFRYLGGQLTESDISLLERVFAENMLSDEERSMVAKSLDLKDLRLIDQFFRIQFDKKDNGFYITKNIQVIGGQGDNQHYSLPSHCLLHQNGPSNYIEKTWLSDGERSRIPSKGPSRVIIALDENGEPKAEGTYFGHSWSFRYRLLGWHNGQYLDSQGVALAPGPQEQRAPGENTPWPWIGEKTTTILASRARDTAEAGVLYYLDQLEKERTVDRPFRSEGAEDRKRSTSAISQEIASTLQGWQFANKLRLNRAIDLGEEDVEEALRSLLERGLVERIKAGRPWKREWIYKIASKAYLEGFMEEQTQEEKWQAAGATLSS